MISLLYGIIFLNSLKERDQTSDYQRQKGEDGNSVEVWIKSTNFQL